MRGVPVSAGAAIGALVRHHLIAVIGAMTLTAPAFAPPLDCAPSTQPSQAVTGQWQETLLCEGLSGGESWPQSVWPDGAMHLLHVPYRDAQGALKGKFIVS